jgi:hypothetical protein
MYMHQPKIFIHRVLMTSYSCFILHLFHSFIIPLNFMLQHLSLLHTPKIDSNPSQIYPSCPSEPHNIIPRIYPRLQLHNLKTTHFTTLYTLFLHRVPLKLQEESSCTPLYPKNILQLLLRTSNLIFFLGFSSNVHIYPVFIMFLCSILGLT